MKRTRRAFPGLFELESRLVPSGTPTLVKDIFPGVAGSVPSNTLVVGSKLYFTAANSTNGNELWVSDGTSVGTALILDINPGIENSDPTELTEVNGRVFFSAFNGNTSGRELWVSDGTAAGTKLVKEIDPTSNGSYPQGLVNVNGTLFFSATNGANGRELWTSNGTSTGTNLVSDILPGPGDGIANGAPRGVNVGGTFFFAATDPNFGTELWTSNGTATGTKIVDISPAQGSSSPFSFTEFNGKAAFVASRPGTQEVFLSDGTTAGTVPITNFNLDTPNANFLTNFNGRLVFRGFTSTTGFEPYISDGTLASTKLLKDIAFFGNSSSPMKFSTVGNTLYFSANNGFSGQELWKTDGTSTGTVLVSDINPGFFSSYPSEITNVAGVAYFAANGGSGYELWRSDGTTTTLVDVEPTSTAFPASLAAMGSRLFFKAFRSDVGSELFRLDEDTLPPTITSIASPNPDGSYYTGTPVTITLTFSEPVVLTGGNLLVTLDTGATLTIPPFTGTTVTLTYIPNSAEFSSDLTVTNISTTASALLTDIAGNPANLTLPLSNLGVTSNILINLPLLPPTISPIANQTANAGDTVGPILFAISDPDSPTQSLTLSVTSSNPGLVPVSAVTLMPGDTSTITVQTQPGVGGVVTLTVIVTDPDGNTASTSFNLIINGPPSISDIPDQTVVAGTVIGPLPFTIGDTETLPDNLLISVTSNNPSFLPPSAVTISGTGVNRTITIATPSVIGGALLTITVTDEGGLVSTDTIAVNTILPPTISDIPDQIVLAGGTVGPLPFTISSQFTPAGALNLSVTSNNAAIPASSITFGGSGANRTITIATTAGVAANTTLTVTVTDPETFLSASDTIVITQYIPPTISDIPDQAVNAGSAVGPLTFTIGGGLSPVNGLGLSVSSSDTSVIPVNAVSFGGSGANRTITVATIAGLSATTVLTVTVTDSLSGLTASDTLSIVQTVPVTPTTFPFVVSRGPGDDSRLRVFNSDFTQKLEFVPIEGYTNGLRSIMADFNGDGVDDVATGTRNYDGKTGAALASRVSVYDGKTLALLFELEPFGAQFFNGLYLSAGDINGDGRAELAVSPFYGGGSRIRVFSPDVHSKFTQMADFFGLQDANGVPDTRFQGGARTAIGDFNGDGFADLVFACGEGGGPRVAIYNGQTLGLNGGPKIVGDFFAMESNLRNGVQIAAGDINGDGRADLVVAPAEGGAPRVRIFSGSMLLENKVAAFADFFAGSPDSRAGLRVAVKNLDGDSRLDLITGSGPGDGNRVSAYHGSDLTVAGFDDPYFAFDAFIDPPRGVWVG